MKTFRALLLAGLLAIVVVSGVSSSQGHLLADPELGQID